LHGTAYISCPAHQLQCLSPSTLQSKTKGLLLVFIILYQINKIYDKIFTPHKQYFQLYIVYIDHLQGILAAQLTVFNMLQESPEDG
jgi:hypothetical protein